MEASQTGVTLSAGVISFASPPASVDEMLHQADALMYKAKSGGKNDILYCEG
jgi:PleD family two-component response regulator